MSERGCSVTIGHAVDEIDPRPAKEMRVSVNEEVVEEYAAAFDHLPPVSIVYDHETRTHWLEDGYQRLLAAKKLKKKDIKATIRNGSYLNAFKGACHANERHGVRVTNADKRKRVEAAFSHEEMKGWSNRRIAEFCDVHHSTVDKIRPEVDVAETATSTRTDSLGRKQPTKKRKPKTKPAPAVDPIEAEPAPPVEDKSEPREEPSAEPEATPPPPPRTGEGWEDNGSFQPSPKHDPLPGQTSIPFGDEDESDPPTRVGPDEDEKGPGDEPGPEGFDFDAEWRCYEARIRADFERWPVEYRSLFTLRLESLSQNLTAMCGDVTNLLEQEISN